MRKSNGFTLVELMVVISILALLLTWGIPAYSSWKHKHDVERQIVRLYNDLQFARLTAYSQKVLAGVCWTNGGGTNTFSSYEVVRDSNNNNSVADNYTPPPATVNATVLSIASSRFTISSSATLACVSFNGRGFLDPLPPAVPLTLSIASSTGAASDCVAISNTRITVGRMNGANCIPQ